MTQAKLKASVAIVFSLVAGVCAAQQASDANAAGMSPAPATGVSGTVDAQQGVYPATSAYPAETRRSMLAACAGLGDRQTERACKDRSSDDANMSLKGNDTGNIEDQAN